MSSSLPLVSLDDTQLSALSTLAGLAASTPGAIPNEAFGDEHVALLRALIASTGRSSDRYPGLFDAVAPEAPSPAATPFTPADTGGYTTGGWIAYVGTTPTGNKVSAEAFCSVADPIARLEAHLLIVDATTQRPLAQGYAEAFLEPMVTIKTNDAQAAAALPNQRLGAHLLWVYWTQAGARVLGSSYSVYSISTLADPTVTAQVVSAARKPPPELDTIQIGLGRGTGSHKDVDYWFDQTNPLVDPLLLPFSGSVSFTQPILVPLDLTVSVALSRESGGLSTILPSSAEGQRILGLFTASGNTLSWSIPSIQFPISPWVSDITTFFGCQMVVTLNDGSSGAAGVASSVTPDSDPRDGVAWIKPIVYVWHCLTADTTITMSDGSTRSIVSLIAGDQVRGARGKIATVRATLRQLHIGEIVVVTFADGKILKGAGTHPVVAKGAFIRLSDLPIGATADTENGSVAVTGVERRPYRAELVNLILDETLSPEGIFYANGVAVGDHNVQVAHDKSLRRNPDFVRSVLPKAHWRDYESYLADAART